MNSSKYRITLFWIIAIGLEAATKTAQILHTFKIPPREVLFLGSSISNDVKGLGVAYGEPSSLWSLS